MTKSKSIRALVVVSDTHCGSVVGLMPPNFETSEGNKIAHNAVQNFLWESWLDAVRFVEDTLAGSAYALVLNGDAIEGDHHGTKQIWSKDIADHVECAGQVLGMLSRRANKTYIVRGTECHTHNTEVTLGKILNAEKNPDSKLPAFDRLHLRVAGVPCAFRHHIGTSVKSWTESTALAGALAEEIIQAVRNGEEPPRVVCAAHRHKFGVIQNAHGMCVVSPPWQMLTRFGFKAVPEARTQPGIYILDWRDKEDGELPDVHERIYRAPKQTTITI